MNGGSLSISSATTSSGTFSGTLAGRGTLDISGQATQYLQTGNKDYDLAVRDGGVLVLKGTADAPTLNYNSITAGNNGTLRIEVTGDAQGSANTTLNVKNITFQNGSTTELIYNFNQDAPFGAPMLTAGTITVQDGAGFLLSNMEGNAAMNAGSDLHDVVLMSATGSISGLEDGQSLAARISGLFAVYYQDATLSRDGNDILLNATLRQENLFASAADTWNSAAGASLLWEARKNLDPDSQLAQFMNGVSTMINDGNLSGASRAMAAAAGSTVNALGTAQRDALRDQMGWIRNRTTLMGVNPAYVNDDLPRFHMWMEGTGSYAKLDTRGDESGYQLTTWGGTVGVDADLSDRLTVGAAFTAGYGDLTASAADSADGRLDSYYASLFGRYQNKRWAHTLILTGGWNDAKLNRTVSYGEGSYGTQGSTSGWGFGAMYELTYDVYLNENRSSVLQPLFNASVVTTRMDGYEETGAGNAGLNVGRDALRDQMGWIRNRTTLMGVNPAYVNDDLPRFHMWMEGTGSYAKLDTRGDESGYQLTTWGGTVGVDADLSDRLTAGAAFTAGYGDLTAGAADSADGRLDSYYASLFGRYQNKRWAHTLILTGGWNDAKLNRTVSYGEGSYGTQGSTSGWGLGAMYELTYDIYLDENRSSVLQPLFNASVVTTRMDGYEETGAGNAGLNVGRQDWTTGTLALGGRESGYQLTTWGGTVGMDADLSDRLTVGAAFTAGYGDLTASAADSADGRLDSYYASLFGRYQNKRWAHTLILTGGWNDAKLNRTVSYGEGSYGTQGSTSGWGFGAMYELTYDVYLNENRSSVLQPLFNASVVTTRMDGYEETGAGNAGLNVGRQDWTTGTLALGGRWMGLVGSNIFGRESLAEIRVNAAQDLGDRRGETNVSLLGNPGFAQSVRGAKTGTAALQLGAGLSVPVGTKGTIYVNGNADIRDGSSSVNGSVGYRYDF
ncbi:autotransporter outer membrane beta-barrel domain-containing protein [Akkermansia muciniphila]|uniref:autotransporter outer membrane beta-barrel domain-containing protein n=1 Tax=Akkermansia muciniphila TaxID=239935 RepID=UPI003CCEA536